MFTIGERVRTRLLNPSGHTRLPGYLRGRAGRVEHVLGAVPFADRRAAGIAEATEVAYTVRFASADVWGSGAEAGSLCADLYESYLEACE